MHLYHCQQQQEEYVAMLHGIHGTVLLLMEYPERSTSVHLMHIACLSPSWLHS
jgi:hypothetical protein